MSENFWFKLEQWMDHFGWTQKTFCTKLAEAEGKPRFTTKGEPTGRSKVDRWKNHGVLPNKTSFDAALKAFGGLDEAMFWQGPSSVSPPFPQKAISLEQGALFFHGKQYDIPVQKPVKTGSLLSSFSWRSTV